MLSLLPKPDVYNNCRAFTLIELLIVVLIIGVLASIALPQYKLAVAKAHLSNIRPTLATLKQAEEVYYLYKGKYTDDSRALDVDLPQCSMDSRWGDVPVCGDWMIDPFNGSAPTREKPSVRGAYCPEVVKDTMEWDDCEEQADYVITYWLHNSAHPDEITCTPKQGSSLGQRICDSINH